jgi:hypothetical protein
VEYIDFSDRTDVVASLPDVPNIANPKCHRMMQGGILYRDAIKVVDRLQIRPVVDSVVDVTESETLAAGIDKVRTSKVCGKVLLWFKCSSTKDDDNRGFIVIERNIKDGNMDNLLHFPRHSASHNNVASALSDDANITFG